MLLFFWQPVQQVVERGLTPKPKEGGVVRFFVPSQHKMVNHTIIMYSAIHEILHMMS